MNNNIPKIASCIRNTSTWANVKSEYKFDANKFNKTKLINDLPLMSPKIHTLLEKIRTLDEIDMKKDGTYYKHIIYSDVDGNNGAKMVASSMIASGYNIIYNNGIIKKCEIIDSNYDEFTEVKIPYRRPSLFKSLPHEQNGFLGTKWKDQATRWNQLRFHNEVSINNELLYNDGLSDLDFVQHGLMRDKKIYHAIIGI